jgi:hypothetical protein
MSEQILRKEILNKPVLGHGLMNLFLTTNIIYYYRKISLIAFIFIKKHK